jgi:16S rRNA (cytosine967-C5)-methyltransferase
VPAERGVSEGGAPVSRGGGAAAAGGTVAPARACAHRVLRRVFEQGAYAEKALAAEAQSLQPRDRALAMRLSYGAVQRRGTSDHLIEALAERPAERLDGPVLASLRLGLYELLYLEGAPDYAVVADAVELAKPRSDAGGGGQRRGGHGLVNAVLRRAAREGRERLLGALHDRDAPGAAVMHSHPEWIARMWWQALGPEDARSLLAFDNEPAELALRANTLVAGRDQLAASLPVRTRLVPEIPEALVLEEPFDLHGSPLWQQGALTAQSRAAMLVARTLAPAAGERVLDLCAAPGGKTTHLAALMGDEGELVAVERNAARARALEATARRMHAGIVRVELADATAPAGHQEFDRVLVDPPCSGLGTLQARPDLRWRASEEALPRLAALQGRILAAGAEALRPGGVLVYSTCTVSPSENERVIADFLHSRPDFRLDELSSQRAAAGAEPASADLDMVRSRTLQTLPHRDRTAGFFIARMRRS